MPDEIAHRQLDRDYLRILDNLAHFYNQQSTAHVGYLLTALISLVACYTPLNDIVRLLALNSWQPWVPVISMGILLFLLLFLTYIIPLFKFLLGRIQYYTCLSEIVLDHMGNSGNQDVFFKLGRRTRMFGGTYGIQDAILSYFEASLYVSLYREKNCTSRGKAIPTDSGWKLVWHVSEFDIQLQTFYAFRPVFSFYVGRHRLFSLFKITDLLHTAYFFKIRVYRQVSEEPIQKIARLLDCPYHICHKCGQPMKLLDEQEHRYYCFKDDTPFVDEPTSP
jgi:hypothetical protein